MNIKVLLAVFKRNFVSYFANPTGYVFICLFVLSSAFAAFWTNDFFNNNLANLDQLNKWFPLIMLMFVPAISMSMWADERRQGTDELLLTMPGGDFEIVLGKYLAAVAILAASLAFSLGCNYGVLRILGQPDLGLFFASYVGYGLIGLAMLAIGMVASFLTANLTVAFVLGVVLNAPLVALVWADSFFSGPTALALKRWSVFEQFRDFGRGVVSLSGLAYFLAIVAVSLYLSMVLISRRHWRESRGTMSNWLFYVLLHAVWLASFATLGIFLGAVLGPRFQAAILPGLTVLYLAIQSALLAAWSTRGGEGRGGYWAVVPMQIAGVVLFVVCAALLRHAPQTPAFLEPGWAMPVLCALYALFHGLCLVGWLLLPARVALTPGQYTLRALALVVAAVGLNLVLSAHDRRIDMTSEGLATLSPDTRDILAKIAGDDNQRPIQIEAFISPEVPEHYVQARLDLISTLQELEAGCRGKVDLRVHATEPHSEEAARAAQRYGIAPRAPVSAGRPSASKVREIFMGVAFTSGLQKVVLPFVDRGIPVEYELVRSLATVTQQKRKRIGIVETDAPLYGKMNFQTFSQSPDWPIVDELKKAYDVVQVNPAQPIAENFDVLLAVQPSSLAPEGLKNVIGALRRGQKAVIFEDPMPYFAGVPGTSAPRRPPMGPMGMPQQNMAKGEIDALFGLLGVRFSGMSGNPEKHGFDPMGGGRNQPKIVGQDSNLPAVLSMLPPEFVFVEAAGAGDTPRFSDKDPISSNLQRVLFAYPGWVERAPDARGKLELTPLVRTSEKTTTVDYANLMQSSMFGPELNPDPLREPAYASYVLAAHIKGKTTVADDPAEAPGGKPKAPPASEANIDVVLVADIDMLAPPLFRLREMGDMPEFGPPLDFDNVTLVLNALDELAGDDRFVEIRKRRPAHRTLTQIEKVTAASQKKLKESFTDLQKKVEKMSKEEDEKIAEDEKPLRKQLEEGSGDVIAITQQLEQRHRQAERRKEQKLEEAREQLGREKDRVETQLNLEKKAWQRWYKLWAVCLPPIPPLVVAGIVFLNRRLREREGVAPSRLRRRGP